jgi:hypothetical protein
MANFLLTQANVSDSIGHITIPILSLRLFSKFLPIQAIVSVDTEDFESLKRYFNIKGIFLCDERLYRL